ncbi:hypothetical protein [Prochlorococcus marinus]|uniref:hypothetical protein n=1 Tax=Prochlorococcus marinus TaxID=1219 RepID=UPI0039B0AC9B
MIRFRNRFFSVFFIIIFVFFVVFSSFDLEVNALSVKQNDELIERIAKDFSKKFCNGVGFGLSQESAVNFAMKENMAIFKNKKGIENIDANSIAEKVSITVVDKCGYQLNLSEDDWGETFAK